MHGGVTEIRGVKRSIGLASLANPLLSGETNSQLAIPDLF